VRTVSLTLALAVLTPYLALPVCAAAVEQGGVASPAAADSEAVGKSLCVVDFSDLSSPGGAGLGRVAAGQFSSQLGEMHRWTVAPDAHLREGVARLKLALPLDRPARVRLAADSGSEQVVFGTITTARIQEKPARQAYVRMMVLVEDARTGELLQSAISEGTSGPNQAATIPPDQLYAEAITNAAASFARYLAEPKVPEFVGPPAPGDLAVDRSVQEDAPLPQREPSATATRIVTDKEAKQVFASVSSPDPVVIDIPRTGLEESGTVRRPLLSNRTLKLLVGGILFAGLLYLGGAGGVGSTRPF
jgi:hypothetical protein